MAKYIKKFANHSAYQTFVQGGEPNFIKPNVSHCVQEGDVHYNPIAQPMVCVLKVEDWQLQNGAKLYDINNITAATFFSKIEVDNVEASLASLDSNSGRYVFSTTGNHTIKYYFDGTVSIPAYGFDGIRFLSISIPSCVTSIGQFAFFDNEYLETVTLPNNSITIGDGSFCSDSLDTASINAISAINPNALGYCHSE